MFYFLFLKMGKNKYADIINTLYIRLDQTNIESKYVEKYKDIGIETLGDLFFTSMKELRKTKKIPSKGMWQAKYNLEEHGFILKEK